MHYRRLACFLLGAWLAGSIFMTMVATQNFGAVDRLLAAPSPEAARDIQVLGQPAARSFLRYQAAELNRVFFTRWEYAQVALGAALLLLLWASGNAGRANVALAALMFAAVLVMRFYLTPEVVRLGRVVETLPAGQVSPERTRFWSFHIAYSVTEVVKLLLGFVLAFRLVRRTPVDLAVPVRAGR